MIDNNVSEEGSGVNRNVNQENNSVGWLEPLGGYKGE